MAGNFKIKTCISEMCLGGDLDKLILKRMEVKNSTNEWKGPVRQKAQEQHMELGKGFKQKQFKD